MRRILSGKFVVRLEPDEHESLKKESRQRGISLNALCREKLGKKKAPSEVAGISTSDILASASTMNVPVSAILLFGSFARGEEHVGSDVDLLMVVPLSVPIERSLYTKWDTTETISRRATHPLSVHFVHAPESLDNPGSLWLECALDGKVLYERADVPISQLQAQIRRQIAEGKWKRKYAYGVAYWLGGIDDQSGAR